MLKKIPSVLSPDLLKVLMEMGHGDEIVLGDGNFPSAEYGKRLVRADGIGIPRLLKAILEFYPLDTYVDAPIILMEVSASDKQPVIWNEYRKIIDESNPQGVHIKHMERFEFYERAKKAYAVVGSGETAVYANIILKKGVVLE